MPPLDDSLRFPTAVEHDPAIDAWLRAQRDDLRPFVETWFERLRRCGGDVRELMQSFYENLWRKKQGRADALRNAQLELLAKNRATEHDALPSTWGAFVLYGDWR